MSSGADPTAAFFANLRASGLLQSAQLEELWAWVANTRPDVQTLAREISRRQWLTAFQLKEIFKGRGRELTLDRFVLRDVLGEGGMGRVYRAFDVRMQREVAVKIIRQDKLSHPAAASRFKHEIEALAKMARHPNVIGVFDADLDGAVQYYAMEFVDGTDLTKLVRDRGPLPIAAGCEYIRQASLGLQHAFESGLVHRDIKPSNLIVSRDGRFVKLVDLGLARLTVNEEATGGEGGHRITQEGFVIGTPDFLAPEQARNPMAVDIRADIYALGGTLFYILTGKVPYDGANPTEKLVKHCTEPPPALRAYRPDAPEILEQVIQWSMAKAPEHRPQTPLQLALALQPFCPPTTGAFAQPMSGRYPIPATVPSSPHSGSHPVPLTPGTGPHAPLPATPAAPQPAYPMPPAPGSPGVPAADPARSSQVFQLPAQYNSDDPIRRRATRGFPWTTVLLVLGGIFVIGLFTWGAYVQFLQSGNGDAPDDFVNSVGLEMVKLPPGTFMMGSPESEPGRSDNEGPQHQVTITGPLLMSTTEVTHGQFLKVMGTSPANSGATAEFAEKYPVESVKWTEAVEFCEKLTEAEKNEPWARKGWAYRLPTEAEWEYAARGGTDTLYAFSPAIEFGKHAVFLPLEEDEFRENGYAVGGDFQEPPRFPHNAGETKANRFGLHDMHGNVWEWCADWYSERYPGTGSRTDPTGPASGSKRVIRGGSHRTPASQVRSATRAGLIPIYRHRPEVSDDRGDVGFRVVYAPVEN